MTFGVTEWEMTRHAVTSVSNTRAGGRDTISQSEAGSDHDWPIRGEEDDRSLADMPTGSVTIVTGSVTIMWRYFVSRHFLVFSFSVKPGLLSVSLCHHLCPSHCLSRGLVLGNIDTQYLCLVTRSMSRLCDGIGTDDAADVWFLLTAKLLACPRLLLDDRAATHLIYADLAAVRTMKWENNVHKMVLKQDVFKIMKKTVPIC